MDARYTCFYVSPSTGTVSRDFIEDSVELKSRQGITRCFDRLVGVEEDFDDRDILDDPVADRQRLSPAAADDVAAHAQVSRRRRDLPQAALHHDLVTAGDH